MWARNRFDRAPNYLTHVMSATLARRSSALARAVRCLAYPATAPTLSASRRVMTTAPIDLARRRFEVNVGSTLRVSAPDGWPPRWPVDVDVVVGEEYEAITVEGSWKPAESWEGERPAPPALDAHATPDGDVIVTLTPTDADYKGLGDAQADMQPRGRGSLRCLVPPRFCGVDVTTGGGDVHIAQVVESAVRVDSCGGNVGFGSIRGADLKVHTAGGSVRADTITADAAIATDGGDVRVGKLVGRTLTVHTLGGDLDVGALFGDVLRADTAGGRVNVDKQMQVSGVGIVRSLGGGVTVRGVAGDGEERIAVDTAGGELVAELGERLHRFEAYTGGGDAAVTVPEGFAIPVTVHGVHGRRRVDGVVEVRGEGGGTDVSGSSFGSSIRVVGGTGDEAARKVAAAAQSATVTIYTLSSAGYTDAELGGLFDVHSGAEEIVDGGEERAGEVTFAVESWFDSVMKNRAEKKAEDPIVATATLAGTASRGRAFSTARAFSTSARAEMSAVSAKAVKELRDKSGAGMMLCKKALTECNGDMDEAVKWLRKKGMASADKKAGRVAAEGAIHSYIHGGSRLGVLVEVNCETDFVARGDRFKELIADIAMQVAASPSVEYVSPEDADPAMVAAEKEVMMKMEDVVSKPENIREKIIQGRLSKFVNEKALLKQPFIKDPSKTVEQLIKEATAEIGEKISVRRFVKYNLGEGIEKKEEDFAAEVEATRTAS